MKRRIIFFSRTLSGGGAEKQMLLTATGLAKAGVDCQVFSLTPPQRHHRYARLIIQARAAGVRVTVPKKAWGKLGFLLRLLGATLQWPRPIVWTWGFSSEAVRVLCPALWWPIGVVAVRDASEEEIRRKMWVLRLGKPLTRCFLSNSHLAIDLIAARQPEARAKAFVIYNSVDLPLLPAGRKPRGDGILRVAMLGNILFHKKGYDRLLILAQQVKARGLPIRFDIGGRQPSTEPDIAQAIRSQGLSGLVVYHGLIDRPFDWLQEADAFLMLSRFEGTSNSLLEAMALGLPCVTTRVGDVGRLHAQGAGLLLLDAPVEQAALETLERMLTESALAGELGQRNRAFCEAHFAHDRMINQTLALLEKI